MVSFEVRKKFFKFFQKNQHEILPSSSLIPQNDPSLLFVNAGMNQFKNVFLGLESPKAKNVVTIQKCLRAGGKHNDLENVGNTPLHHTFFEMLGNFSFGDYFKQKAISLAWEFLTEELKLPPEHLWVTVHNKDEESYTIWREEQKIPENKIYKLGDKDNFWQMADTGPCGPCSEIHYYSGKEKLPDPSHFMEIWNLVFMEFYDELRGERKKLPVPCVDTGMGLERLCSFLQNKKSNYHTDLFSEILLALEKHCDFKYDFKEANQTEQQKAFRVLADHSRALSFLISEGVLPGNDKESYVLRRIMRRALYYSQKLQPKKNLLQVGVEKTISLMSEVYPELKEEEKIIQSIVEEETKRFSDSLKEGRKKLEEKIQLLSTAKGKSIPEKFIPTETVWDLYSTYGFPMDLTRLISREKGWTMANEEELEKYKNNLLKDSNLDSKEVPLEKNKTAILNKVIDSLTLEQRKTVWTAYEKDKETAQVLAVTALASSKVTASNQFIKKGSKGFVIFDRTCFYPESGGPLGDRGCLKEKTGKQILANVLDCVKKGECIVHEVLALEDIKVDQTYLMEVDKNFRQGIKSAHTATHLLNSALRSVLGKSVRQAGSLVEPNRLRFDFTHPRPLTKKECQEIEELVWQSIEKEEALSSAYKSFNQAKEEGFLFLQGENYEQEARVISIGNQTSKELCGGIHVSNTKEIEDFKIVSERAVQSGVRRIVAYTGSLARAWENFLIHQNLELRKYLKLPVPKANKEGFVWTAQMEEKNPFLKWLEEKDKELKALKKNIIHLEEKEQAPSSSKNIEFIKFKSSTHPLVIQNLELREHLKISLPKEKGIGSYVFESQKAMESDFKKLFKESGNPLLDGIKIKEQEAQQLEKQWTKIKQLNLTKEKLLQQAKDFKLKGLKGKLLVVSFPLEDRKILSDLSDSLLALLSSGVLVLLGESEDKSPIFVSLTKDFQKVLSAGELLKNTIAPLCKGRGGGKASFAQGSISDPSAFSSLSEQLLKQWIKQ